MNEVRSNLLGRLLRPVLFNVLASSVLLAFSYIIGRLPRANMLVIIIGLVPMMVTVLITAPIWTKYQWPQRPEVSRVLGGLIGFLLGAFTWAVVFFMGIWPPAFWGAIWVPTAWMGGGAAGIVVASRVHDIWRPTVTKEEVLIIGGFVILSGSLLFVPMIA